MIQPTMIRAKGDGVQIQLAVWEGEEKTILCVHGLTANSRCWDVIAPALAPRHRVMAVDLRGRGLSDKPPTGYSEENHIRDLHHLMDDLQLEHAVFMGHSLGGYVALGFAARYPERVEKLILMDGGAELSRDHWDRVSQAIKPAIDRLELTFPTVVAFMDLMKMAPFLQPWSDEIEAYFRYDLEDTPQGVRSRIQPEHIREEIASKLNTGAGQYYSKLDCPVLILRATEGILTPDDILLPADAVERMLDKIPDARVIDLNGTDHYSILFQPNPDRDREILNFLQS